MKEAMIKDIEQQRLNEILGQPESGHLSCTDLGLLHGHLNKNPLFLCRFKNYVYLCKQITKSL